MKAFLRSVSMVSLLRMVVGMMLPEGRLRSLCDTLMGLMAMLAALQAVFRLLPGWRG